MNLTGRSGQITEVDSDGRALVDAKSEFLAAAMVGDAYIWTNETYSATGVDTILIVRNDNSSKDLYITKIRLHSVTETEVEIHVPSAAYSGTGTAVLGENLNRTIRKAAEATAICDETDNAQGDIIERVRIKADVDFLVDFEGGLVLGSGDAVGVDYATTSAEVHVSIWGYFK